MATNEPFPSTSTGVGQPRPGRQPVPLAERWKVWAIEGFGFDLRRHATVGLVLTADTKELLASHADTLLERLADTTPVAAVLGYIDEPETWHERLERHVAVRMLEKLTNVGHDPLDLPAGCHPDPNLRRRPLTPLEQGLVRVCALTGGPARTLAVAALDAGCASGELAALRAAMIRCGTNVRAETLAAPGCRDAAARALPLPPWCRSAFTAHVAALTEDTLLLYRGDTATHPAKIQSCVLMNVTNTLHDAGLSHDPTVKPLSIRNGTARRVHEAGGLEAAAALLGSTNYSTVAREIGLNAHKPARTRRVQ